MLSRKIEDLKMVIDVAEGNYKTGLQSKLDNAILRAMKGHIRKLKLDIQILIDQQSVIKFGELPDVNFPILHMSLKYPPHPTAYLIDFIVTCELCKIFQELYNAGKSIFQDLYSIQ